MPNHPPLISLNINTVQLSWKKTLNLQIEQENQLPQSYHFTINQNYTQSKSRENVAHAGREYMEKSYKSRIETPMYLILFLTPDDSFIYLISQTPQT